MLLSNIAVAQHVAVHLPEQALLRRHDTPVERRLVCSLVQLSPIPILTDRVECVCRAGRTPGL